MNNVHILNTPDYRDETLRSAVRGHFTNLRLKDELKPGIRVLIKPNLLMKRTPDAGTTTHPALVRAVIDELKAAGVTDITLADSPGGPYMKSYLSSVYDATGMTAVCRETGITLNEDLTSFTKKAPEGANIGSFSLIAPLSSCDLIINLPKLKTHCMTGMSCAVKNMYGCIPGLQKGELHYRFKQKDTFSRMLIDLSLTIGRYITIVDGVDAMEGNGPSGGDKRHVGLTISSDNPFALDDAVLRLIGLKPDEVQTVKQSAQLKLYDKVAITGDYTEVHPIEGFKKPDTHSVDFLSRAPAFIRKPIAAVATKLLAPKPRILKNCIGCGKCAEVCPAKVITIKDKKAIINKRECIACYCCHEMCPVKAVAVR